MARLSEIKASDKLKKLHGQCPQWIECEVCGQKGCSACILGGRCPECFHADRKRPAS